MDEKMDGAINNAFQRMLHQQATLEHLRNAALKVGRKRLQSLLAKRQESHVAAPPLALE